MGGVVERTRAFVDEVVVAADGSRDGTAAAARAAGAHVPEPEAVRGKAFAIIKGVRACRDLEPDVVVILDADGQHLPEEIPAVAAPVLAGEADVVNGSRMLGTLRTSRLMKWGNLALKIVSFALTWRWITDTETGFRAFRAEKLFALELRSRGYEIESELILKSMHRGYVIREVPITVPFAVPGVTAADGLQVAWYKVRTVLRLKLGREPA